MALSGGYYTNGYNHIGKINFCKNRYKTIIWDNCIITYKPKDENIIVKIITIYFLELIVQFYTIHQSEVLL